MIGIGTNIRIHRRKRGLSLSAFARKCEISKSYLHNIESGKGVDNISIDVASRIANVLNISLDTLASSKTATAYMRGHLCYFNQTLQQWHYMDNDDVFDDNRPCPKCKCLPDGDYDACIGKLDGAVSVCCGHGIEDGYVFWGNKKDGE